MGFYFPKSVKFGPMRLNFSKSGLAPEFVELAEERMKEINAAYEELKRRVTAV